MKRSSSATFERRHRLQTLHHEVAVPCREHEVEEDEVWVLLARLVDGRDRIAREERLVTARLQPDAEKPTDVLVVVDDEDLGLSHIA